MRLAVIFLLSLVAAACSIPRSIPEGGAIPGQLVSPSGKALILAVADGQEHGDVPAVGSGRGMVRAIRKALTEHGVPMSITDTGVVANGFNEAASGGFTYLLRTSITLWEDNATAWSMQGDKLNISVELYDVKSRLLVAGASHRRVATGFTMMSGTPDRFMDECAEGALGKIYGWPSNR